MVIGKVPENVLKRSILNRIRSKRSEVLVGADVGVDCAVLSFKDSEYFYSSVNTKSLPVKDNASLSLCAAINSVAAAGAEPISAEVSVVLPEGTEEKSVKSIYETLDALAAKLQVQISGCHTEVSNAVTRPVVTVTGIGKSEERFSNTAKPGDDIVVTKWIGLEGTNIIAHELEDRLLKKFPQKMIYDAENFDKYLSVRGEAATAVKSGVSAMYAAGEGGIFNALWKLAQGSGVGLEVDMLKLPVKQETIEISNFCDINPYELASMGCLVIAASDGNELVMRLKEQGINAVTVGKITDSNDRVVINRETRRFLEPSGNEEIYKIF